MGSLRIGSVLLTELLPALHGMHGARSRIREHILIVLYEMHKDTSHHLGSAKKGLLAFRVQPPAGAGFSSKGGKSSACTESRDHKDVVLYRGWRPSVKLLAKVVQRALAQKCSILQANYSS